MPPPTKIQITEEFARAFEAMRSGASPLLITGPAGVGKSTLLREFCEQARADRRVALPVVLAPTGVAALNVGGMTIHRFFGFSIDVTPQRVNRPRKGRAKLYKRLSTIIIDEASMLRADLLDCIERFLRKNGPNPGELFGGVQMVFIGDLYQLPPVVTSMESDALAHHYPSPHFFSAKSLLGIDVTILELTQVFRQSDTHFIEMLHRLRVNDLSDNDLTVINKRVSVAFRPGPDDNYITLTGTNRRANEINMQRLQSINKKLHISRAQIKNPKAFTKGSFPTEEELHFKKGAQVMLLNNDQHDRWVNGSLGVITDISSKPGEECVSVRFPGSNRVCFVEPHEWEMIRFELQGGQIVSTPAGSFTQFPFKLAWAVTVHKSQGKTFDRMILDLDRVFETGQAYVALSRCTSLEGIVLARPLMRSQIRADNRVQRFLAGQPMEDLLRGQLFGQAS